MKGAPVASHLTITSGSTPAAFGKASGPQGDDARSGLGGLFAALLGGSATIPGGTAQQSGENAASLNIGDLLKLGLETGDTDNKDGEAPDPEALAAALGGAIPAVPQVTPQPLVDFIDALSALKTSLDAGQPLDPDLLKKVETALDGLADALGLDLSQLALPEDFSKLLGGLDGKSANLANTLAGALGPIAQSLAGAQPATDASALEGAGSATALLQAIGDKLAGLIAVLEDGEVSPDKLNALGMGKGQAVDARIEAALARLAEGTKPDASALPDQPELAKPKLEPSQPTLTGSAGSAASPAEATKDGAGKSGSDKGEDSGPDKAHEMRAEKREARADTAANPPPPADASNNPAPTGSQQTGFRVDAAANPRIVQTGYQTSQQQLNLPQIAFELGRQVTEGNTRFQIRLDPPELGRIDVRLDIDKSGQVNARLTVEKAETLDLMQRDQRGLEKALQQAGLDNSKTNLEFSLKQNPFAGSQGQQQQSAHAQEGPFRLAGSPEEAEPSAPTVNLYRGSLVASGVNIIA